MEILGITRVQISLEEIFENMSHCIVCDVFNLLCSFLTTYLFVYYN
ncbi:CRPV-124 [Crowpox virus]|nr:CRPV-124 [Crowpox virus]